MNGTVSELALPIPEMEITPPHGWATINFGELWRYRELLHFFVLREIKVRYAQTSLGVAWVVVQPLAAAIIFSIFLGRLGKISSDNAPYPLFVFAALVPWTFFSNALTNSSVSLVNSAHLIAKIYFPRQLLPLSAILANSLDLVVMFTLLLIAMIVYPHYHMSFGAQTWWLPAFVLLAACCALGLGLFLSALNVAYRDVKHTVPFLMQIWLFASPVAYSTSLVPERWRTLYSLNPMVTVINGFRWTLLGDKAPEANAILVSSVTVALGLIIGATYFHRRERNFADVI